MAPELGSGSDSSVEGLNILTIGSFRCCDHFIEANKHKYSKLDVSINYNVLYHIKYKGIKGMIIFTLVGSLQESKVKQISAEEEAGETVE